MNDEQENKSKHLWVLDQLIHYLANKYALMSVGHLAQSLWKVFGMVKCELVDNMVRQIDCWLNKHILKVLIHELVLT